MKLSLKKSPSLFIFLCAFSVAGTRSLDKTVVSVNGEVILESDVQKFSNKLQSKSFQELFGGVDKDLTKEKDGVLNLLIEERLINQQVKKLDLTASDQEVDAQIRAITRRNGISTEQLNERLKQLGSSMTEYKEGIRRQIERKNLIDREIKPSLEVSEEQLRHYYLRNSGPGGGGETQYRIAHILIGDKKGQAGAKRANEVYELVKGAPDQFDKFAKEYSDDSATSGSGGDLGFLSLSSMNKEFKTAVAKLQLGEVSAPVKMGSSYHILKVLDTKSPDFNQLPKETKEAIRAQMLNSEVEKKLLLWLDRKKTEAHITKLGSQKSESKK